MAGLDRPADKIRKLVTLAVSGDTPETRNAAAMARRQIVSLNTELLDTLAGQRARLLEDLREENRRLIYERATKGDTGELVSRAMMLLGHYERVDALLATVLLLRVEDGRALSNDERQQLDGPKETILDRWERRSREMRKEKREARRRKTQERN